MAEAAKPHTAATEQKKDEPKKADKELTPEEKDKAIQEANEKANEEREKIINDTIGNLQKRLEEYGSENLNSILTEIKSRIGTMWVVAAGADMGTPTPQTVKELTEEHTPYITPPAKLGRTPSTNIALHVEEMDEAQKAGKKGKSKEESKKAA